MSFYQQMAGFTLKSAICRALCRSLGAAVSTERALTGREMAELLMKSAIVELGAYAHPRAAPLLDAGAGPAILAVMPAGQPWLLALLTG